MKLRRALSLRVRLTTIILAPLIVFAVLAGFWQLSNARQTADEVFNRSLLSAAIAVANDVAISEGDALSERTRSILASTSGGRVFYHVYAPDGVIVAGYATPPVGIPRSTGEAAAQTYFNARYLGRDVIGVRIQNRADIDDFAGIFTTTVWQDRRVRQAFSQELLTRSLLAIASLISLLAVTVWFGVRLGLRPLLSLEAAIEQRSSDDLSPIRRAVPAEVQGIVATLNQLFGQVGQSMIAQSDFVANAAHQLRNPIAGVLALAEAVKSAPTEQATVQRADDLLDAAREIADLSKKLLILERADALVPAAGFERFDLSDTVDSVVRRARLSLPEAVTLTFSKPEDPVWLLGDQTMIQEAVVNLIDNALRHGGPGLSMIVIALSQDSTRVLITVHDNGQGLADDQLEQALERFSPVANSNSSGLGLAIVRAVAQAHGGDVTLVNDNGLRVGVVFVSR